MLSPTDRQRLVVALQADNVPNNIDAKFTAEIQRELAPADIFQFSFLLSLLDVIGYAIPNHM